MSSSLAAAGRGGRTGRGLLALALCLLLGLCGCSRYGQVLDECLLLAGDCRYEEALRALEKSSLARSQRDRLLYLLEKGMLLHLQGAYRESSAVLEEADRLSEELYTLSLSAEGLAFALNDTVTAYVGADYETVYLNYLKGLNYLATGTPQSAAVECRRINEKLSVIEDRGDTLHGGEAFLRLFCGLVYEATAAPNDAFISYRKSWQAYRAQADVPLPALLASRLWVTARAAGLYEEAAELEVGGEVLSPPFAVLLVHNGRIATREETFAFFPSGRGFPVKIAVPRLVPRAGGVRQIEVCQEEACHAVVGGVNLSAVAGHSLDASLNRQLAKSIARAVLRETAAREIEQQHGAALGLLTRFFSVAVEQPDLRSWQSLPHDIRLVLLPLEGAREGVILRLDGRTLPELLVPRGSPIAFAFARVL